MNDKLGLPCYNYILWETSSGKTEKEKEKERRETSEWGKDG